MKPKNVKTFEQICKMKRDNWSYGDFCIGFNGENELYLHEQKVGENCKQKFLIPKHVFNHFTKIFNRDY